MDDYFKLFDNVTPLPICIIKPDSNEPSKETSKVDTCNKCCENNDNIIITNNSSICTKCGKTIKNISNEAEWRYYGCNDSKSSNPTRCGMPINNLLPKSSIGTTISLKNNNKNMNQIRKFHMWSGGMPYKERSLYLVFNHIQEKSSKSGIPKKIIEDAKNIYKQISERKISRGANRKGIIASCVYFACKLNAVPRSTKEIAKMFDLNITVMTKGCKLFQNIIQLNDLKNSIMNNHITHTESINSLDFIDRFCSKLSINKEDIQQIKLIATNAEKNNLVGQNTPPSIASGCIYLYCINNNLPLSKKDISDVCLISEVTINKCYKNLNENIDILI
jgi:transcription initiation factor TFIIB